MDFNDLKLRIERIYSAVFGLSTEEVETSTHVQEVIDQKTGIRGTIINFGARTTTERLNIVFNAISLIASMKDHLINKSNTKYTKKDVENLINSSLALSLIIDLNNKDKHGDPLKRQKRTNKNPKLGELSEAMKLDGKSAITIDALTGEISRIGAPKIVIQGDVFDDRGEMIMDIETMFNEALDAVEQFVNINNLISKE